MSQANNFATSLVDFATCVRIQNGHQVPVQINFTQHVTKVIMVHLWCQKFSISNSLQVSRI